MPVYRGPDGKIIEEKTNKLEDVTQSTDRAQRPLPPPQPGSDQAAGAGRLDAPTQKMDASGSSSNAITEEKTRVVGGRRSQEDQQHLEERAEKVDGMDDPVVGWLVIVEGPGKGRAMQLGYGSNSIGRGETDRVNLNFGDDQISRSGHATVTYDPRGRKFYVQHGGGTNLTYVNDQPVLIPIELPTQSHISIGNTILRFVPLCGDAFDWQDTEENARE